MAEVCKWLGFYLCMRNTPKTDAIHGSELQTYDAVIVYKECPIGKAGGMAYEVVLKPAVVVTPKRPMSPPKDRVISKDEIMHKLKDAEERRLSAEVSKLHQVSLSKERAQKAVLRAKELNNSFCRDTEKKLNDKLDVTEKNKTEQLRLLKNRLSAHDEHISDVRLKKLEQDTTSNGATSNGAASNGTTSNGAASNGC